MAEPDLVADCVRAMREVVKVPVTVKHRIGLDRDESYDFVARFVDRVAQAGCKVFIVHARNAWLQGLSPKENREVPPLRYETVYRLKRDFPSLTIVINGGLRSHEDALKQLDHVDGVMLGRAACDDPWLLARVDSRFYGAVDPIDDRLQVLEAIRPFLAQQVVEGVSARAVLRHVMGLFNGLPGARAWRRTLSDSALLAQYGAVRSIRRSLECFARRREWQEKRSPRDQLRWCQAAHLVPGHWRLVPTLPSDRS